MRKDVLNRDLEEMLHLINKHKITSYGIRKGTGMSISSVDKILTKETTNPRKDTLKKLDDFLIIKYPLVSTDAYGFLDNLEPDVLVNYMFDRLNRFEDTTAFKMFKSYITNKDKSKFVSKKNKILMKLLDDIEE